MFETIVAIVLLVVLPYLFHKWVTSSYHKQEHLFFGENDRVEEFDLNNVGSEEK